MQDSPDLNHSTDTEAAGTARRHSSGAYLLSILAGLVGGLAAFGAVLLALHSTDNLPPPAFANSLCVDEKLNFMRENTVTKPDLLVIGSSVAWRHFDGDAIVKRFPGMAPLNGAFCGLHINQSVYVANWLLDREPSIRHVVLIADPQDFAGCWRVRDAVFDREDADAYVYGGASPWRYYLRYFAPVSLVRNASSIKDQRSGDIEWDPLVFSQYGDGPLRPAGDRGLFYGAPEPLDAGCFQALKSLTARLAHEGKGLTVVSTPLHPKWKQKEDPDGTFLAEYDQRIVQAISGADRVSYWNADREWPTAPDYFVDAIHLRWSAAQRFSVALAEQLALDDPEASKPL